MLPSKTASLRLRRLAGVLDGSGGEALSTKVTFLFARGVAGSVFVLLFSLVMANAAGTLLALDVLPSAFVPLDLLDLGVLGTGCVPFAALRLGVSRMLVSVEEQIDAGVQESWREGPSPVTPGHLLEGSARTRGGCNDGSALRDASDAPSVHKAS